MSYLMNLGMMLAVVVLVSFFYFVHNMNRFGIGALFMLATIGSAFYFLHWWQALLGTGFGLYFGSKISRMRLNEASDADGVLKRRENDDLLE